MYFKVVWEMGYIQKSHFSQRHEWFGNFSLEGAWLLWLLQGKVPNGMRHNYRICEITYFYLDWGGTISKLWNKLTCVACVYVLLPRNWRKCHNHAPCLPHLHTLPQPRTAVITPGDPWCWISFRITRQILLHYIILWNSCLAQSGCWCFYSHLTTAP